MRTLVVWKLNFHYKLEKTGGKCDVFSCKFTEQNAHVQWTKLSHNSCLVVWISSSIILSVSCKLQSSFSIFLLEEKQTVFVIRKNRSISPILDDMLLVRTTGTKNWRKANPTSIYNDSHLDLTFLWVEPKQFKRLKNCKTPILPNLRIKYQTKI